MMSQEKPLELKELTKNYGEVRALKGVSLEMNPGEVLGLLGPNGAGKTSIISILTTLEQPSSGTAKIFGRDVTVPDRERKTFLGVVPQETVSHGFFSILEILHFHSGYYGIRHNEDRIKYILDRLGLWAHRDKRVKQLSGGMKRRLLIAKALVHNPKLLLLDEPTAGVDIELRTTLWKFVRELNKEGMSILLTTHYLEEAEELCDRVAIIHHGEIRRVGETSSLIRSLTHREITLFLVSDISGVEHPLLVRKEEKTLVFNVGHDLDLGHLLKDLSIPVDQLRDVRIREGNLEDAFVRVLGESV